MHSYHALINAYATGAYAALHLITASTEPEVRCLLYASPVVRPCVPHHCGKNYWYTTDGGRRYHSLDAPLPPNTFGAVIVHFQPKSDYLIWTGNADCDGDARNCHAEAHYTTDNGRTWKRIETYVRNCAWARDKELRVDMTEIICESYKEKTGNQRMFDVNINPLQLYAGSSFYSKKKLLFERVVGFAKFSEFLIVAEVRDSCDFVERLS